MTDLYWLSFVDTDHPDGDRFLGVAIVQGTGVEDAVATTWALGINPGGEVMIVGPIAEGTYAATDMDRLLTKAEATAVIAEQVIS